MRVVVIERGGGLSEGMKQQTETRHDHIHQFILHWRTFRYHPTRLRKWINHCFKAFLWVVVIWVTSIWSGCGAPNRWWTYFIAFSHLHGDVYATGIFCSLVLLALRPFPVHNLRCIGMPFGKNGGSWPGAPHLGSGGHAHRDPYMSNRIVVELHAWLHPNIAQWSYICSDIWGYSSNTWFFFSTASAMAVFCCWKSAWLARSAWHNRFVQLHRQTTYTLIAFCPTTDHALPESIQQHFSQKIMWHFEEK